MSRTQIASTLAALLHLAATVAFVWTGFAERPGWGVAGELLRLYKNASGAFRDYTFFAPSVASDLKAGFLLEGPDEKARFVHFSAQNKEIAFRYNCIVAACMRDVKGRDLFARSWAAVFLTPGSGVDRTTVMVKALDMPTMGAYRHGTRPEWRTIYASTFGRNAR